MNATIQELFDRKSVRIFTEKPISQENKALILDAALQAPTAGNLMLYSILDITDQNIKDRLSETCDHQAFIAKAPMILIFCADTDRLFEGFKLIGSTDVSVGAGDLLLSLSDALIASQNAVVAAWSLGIGSCYIGDIIENVEIHRELLHLPDTVVPIGMLVFGYPVQQQFERKKPTRLRREFIVHENHYHKTDAAQLQAMFKTQADDAGLPFLDYKSTLSAIYKRKFASDFWREMQRSASILIEPFIKK